MDVVARIHMILKMILFWSQMHAWSSRIFSRKLCLILSRDIPLQNICVVKKKFQCVLIYMDGEDLDANFIVQLVDGDDVDEGGDEDDMDVDEEPVSKFKNLRKVIKELDEIKLKKNNINGCAGEASAVTSAVDMVTSLHIASMKQICPGTNCLAFFGKYGYA